MDMIKYVKQLLEKYRVYPKNIKKIVIEKDKRFLGKYLLWVTIDNWKEQRRHSPFIKLGEYPVYGDAEEIALTIEFDIVPDKEKIQTFYCQK